MSTLGHRLLEICAALDDALGDGDISHIEDEELRVEYPVQWGGGKAQPPYRPKSLTRACSIRT